MFIKTQFQTLYAYHWHNTSRLLKVAAKLDDAVYFDNPGYGHGSIHDLLLHMLSTDHGWRHGLEGQPQPPGLTKEEYPDLKSILAGFNNEQQKWTALLDGYDDAAIQGIVTLTDRRGAQEPFPLWRVLQHLILHGMQHHTEIAQLLTTKGYSPGDLDFIFYDG